MHKSAHLSRDRIYRYSLTRTWEVGAGTAVFIGLNPSTADENLDDPTIRRCIGFAKSWGLGQIRMVNLFAYRATSPDDMKGAVEPCGALNDAAIIDTCCNHTDGQVGTIVCAWGKHGTFRGRGEEVIATLQRKSLHLCCLGINKDGTPKHPLYLRSDTKLQLFRSGDA